MGYPTRPDVEHQELIIRAPAGQKVTVVPEPGTLPGLILKTSIKRAPNGDKVRAAVYVDGEWIIVPEPPVDPPVPPMPPTTVPFLSRPASSPLTFRGGTSVTVANKTIRGPGVNNPSGIGIFLEGVRGTITIRDIDLADLIGGIFMRDCEGTLILENVRSRNIGNVSDANKDIGSGHGNHIQLAECSFDGFVRKNQFLGGRTEDMLSTWHSGGRGQGRELVWEDNRLQGLITDIPTARAWASSSGTGIILSDGKGSNKNGHQIVRRNSFLTCGQVIVQIIDGPNLTIAENLILGQRRPLNNNPMTTWEGVPSGVARDNRYYLTRENGETPGPWLNQHPGGAGSKVADIGNVEDPSLSAAAMRVEL